MFDAILVSEPGAARLERLDEADLPPGDVLVRVSWSTLNYKDGLAITGKGKVIRTYPMVPGIDLAGVVERSEHPDWKPGDRVVANGWGLGETRWGGLAGKARVRGEWLIPLPEPFTLREAAAVGTAGYTAALCVLALERHGLRPGAKGSGGEVLVTGAAGGVGSVAVALLARAGFDVVAMTGRAEEEPYLRRLGAAAVIGREGYAAPGKPLLSERWAGAVDVAGGAVLANVLAATREEGAVAACGLAAGMELPATVAPFILRGVSLLGINCVTAPRARRQEAWERLARDLDRALLAGMVEEVALPDTIAAAGRFVAGRVRGRIVVPLGGEE